LRDSSLPTDKVARVSPVGIREGCPDLREASSHGLTACVPRAADVWARRGFENTVFGHERHEGIDVVAIPRIGKSLQELRGDLSNQIRHVRPLRSVSGRGLVVMT